MNFSRLSVLVGAVTAAAVSIAAFPSSANALIFNFSLPNSTGSESGTVTGTLVLPDTVGTNTAGASSLIIGSAPGALSGFNGLQLISNSNYNVQVNQFTYNSTSVSVTDLVIASNTAFFGGNFLAFRFRNGDLSFPSNLFAASTSNNQLNISNGSSIINPSVLNLSPSQVTFTPVAVPFDIPGGATIPAVGGLLALGLMRKARKSLASNTRVSKPMSEIVS